MAVKTMINSPTYGRFVFDAVFNTSHNANLMVTEHPVQSGGSIADHAFMEPDEVQMEIGMSDTAISVGTKSLRQCVHTAARNYGVTRAGHARHSTENLSEYADCQPVRSRRLHDHERAPGKR